ncbi:hypothetical protein D3C80_1547280 [compost metagenome]
MVLRIRLPGFRRIKDPVLCSCEVFLNPTVERKLKGKLVVIVVQHTIYIPTGIGSLFVGSANTGIPGISSGRFQPDIDQTAVSFRFVFCRGSGNDFNTLDLIGWNGLKQVCQIVGRQTLQMIVYHHQNFTFPYN